jgi:non-heme chloroperoxidase
MLTNPFFLSAMTVALSECARSRTSISRYARCLIVIAALPSFGAVLANAQSTAGMTPSTAQVLTPQKEERESWQDRSPHHVQFVTVDKDLRLEVLDWGGSGQPVVLLSGLGDTAHIFDAFAPQLTARYHVYGITRRGFGASSSPSSGYSADRLGDDVLAVLNSCKIARPVLVGHSLAGEELSYIGTRYPERVTALIYLDAAQEYAYWDPVLGDYRIDLADLQRTLDHLQEHPTDINGIRQLLQADLPRFEHDLKVQEESLALFSDIPSSQSPAAEDRSSFSAFHLYMTAYVGVDIPEAELREMYEINPDGSVGRIRANPAVFKGIASGEERFTGPHVPILAIYTIPRTHGSQLDKIPETLRTELESRETSLNQKQADAFKAGVPTARVVILPNANHVVFLSNETEVLHEMTSFIRQLETQTSLP